jgi:hypothetical protein
VPRVKKPSQWDGSRASRPIHTTTTTPLPPQFPPPDTCCHPHDQKQNQAPSTHSHTPHQVKARSSIESNKPTTAIMNSSFIGLKPAAAAAQANTAAASSPMKQQVQVAPEGRRAALLGLAAVLAVTATTAGSAKAGVFDEYLEKSKANKVDLFFLCVWLYIYPSCCLFQWK